MISADVSWLKSTPSTHPTRLGSAEARSEVAWHLECASRLGARQSHRLGSDVSTTIILFWNPCERSPKTWLMLIGCSPSVFNVLQRLMSHFLMLWSQFGRLNIRKPRRQGDSGAFLGFGCCLLPGFSLDWNIKSHTLEITLGIVKYLNIPLNIPRFPRFPRFIFFNHGIHGNHGRMVIGP